MSYWKSILSLKKLNYRKVSIFAVWDSQSSISVDSEIRHFVKLKKSIVGKYSRINPFCTVFNAQIGNFTAIGRNSSIGLGQHPLNYISTQNIFYKKNNLSNKWVNPIDFPSKPISIGNDVWIGVESLIMDGVTIGNGAVVGARSVVTKDVPPYAIVVGSPARIVRYRFDDEIIDLLLNLKWWDKEDDFLTDHIEYFRKPLLTKQDIIELTNEANSTKLK